MGQTTATFRKDDAKELKLIDEAKQLYLNLRSGRMYTRSTIVLGDIADREYELDIYTFRRLNERFVVSVDYCSPPQEIETCSTSSVLTYFVEHHHHTLLEANMIPLQKGFTLLLHVLQGFSILYNKFGYFTANSRLIFFNHINETKVWLTEDLKVTRNLQNPHGPKSAAQQNLMVREIVRLFDSLRDPANPMIRYSQFLPNNFLTFASAIDTFLKKSIEISCRTLPQKQVFAQVKNIRPPPPPLLIKPQHHHPISYQNSPVVSPRYQSPRCIKKENQPMLSFTYQSPERSVIQTPIHGISSSLQKEEIKQATKLSLKNTTLTVRPSHRIQPSREFTSTMPNSIRNSGVFEKHLIIEKLDPTPTISRKNSANDIKIEDNPIKKQAAQRYSEAEQHTIAFECKPKARFLKVSLQEKTQNASADMDNNNEIASNKDYDEQKGSFNFIQKRAKNQSGPTLNEPGTRREFQSHKRHQTDFKLLSKMRDSNDSHPNQISLMDGNYLSKFNLNTIKSIHLLDEDKQFDRQIIVDLKHIINKYRKLA